jgi:hypothetical protein
LNKFCLHIGNSVKNEVKKKKEYLDFRLRLKEGVPFACHKYVLNGTTHSSQYKFCDHRRQQFHDHTYMYKSA